MFPSRTEFENQFTINGFITRSSLSPSKTLLDYKIYSISCCPTETTIAIANAKTFLSSKENKWA